MGMSWFRGVLWPRRPLWKGKGKAKRKVYRYVVVGMLVSEKPLPDLPSNNLWLEGFGGALWDAMAALPKQKNRFGGTADSVLTNLDNPEYLKSHQ